MARRAGPSARSRRLARTLRRLRSESGASAAEVGKALGMSGSKLNRIETSDIGIYQDDLEKLLDYYRVPKKRRVELLDIARHAEERGWLRMRNANLPADWQAWSDFEDEASSLLNYEPMTIPGLLQTAEYARCIIEATGAGLSERDIDDLVSSRMARQGLLNKAVPVQFHAIIESGVLTRPFGSAGARERQLRHLIDQAGRSDITVQVIQTEAGMHPGLNGPFAILEYDAEPSLVWLESKLVSMFLEEDDQIESYGQIWDELAKLALGPQESVELIQALLGSQS
jgi:transcriptional regulator with XRE-family HTH domain